MPHSHIFFAVHAQLFATVITGRLGPSTARCRRDSGAAATARPLFSFSDYLSAWRLLAPHHRRIRVQQGVRSTWIQIYLGLEASQVNANSRHIQLSRALQAAATRQSGSTQPPHVERHVRAKDLLTATGRYFEHCCMGEVDAEAAACSRQNPSPPNL